MTGPTPVEEYIEGLPEERRPAMEAMREAIRAGAPEAIEAIAYNMPAFRSHGGQFLVSFDAYKQHYSLFPASEEVVNRLGEEIAPYLAGKGTIRFPASRPIPVELVRRIAEIRFAENGARGGR
ncbi:MAG TPA: DUF1801 domain-containing protein [Candidatus Limnocylindrales bacterium]|jgi:uncharacterized protein YdhG (YjbR/CyaY superfamily)